MTAVESRPVRLAELVREKQWYPREQLNTARAAEYEAEYRERGPDALPPIQVGVLPGVSGLPLVDGWHRAAAAQQAGLEWLPGLVRPYPDGWAVYADAIRLANGGQLKLQPGEKQRSIDAFLQQFPEMKPRPMARLLGVSHVYVWQRRQAVYPERATTDPQLQALRALLREWAKGCAGQTGEEQPWTEEGLDRVAGALAMVADGQFQGGTGLWLQRLEEAAHQAWQLWAAGEHPRLPRRSRKRR